MFRRMLALLIGVSMLLQPVLCTAGVLVHGCPEPHAEDHDGPAEDCGHESDCMADPCSDSSLPAALGQRGLLATPAVAELRPLAAFPLPQPLLAGCLIRDRRPTTAVLPSDVPLRI
ncbi:MAG: hypothetical protein R3B81_11605 [bacterium]